MILHSKETVTNLQQQIIPDMAPCSPLLSSPLWPLSTPCCCRSESLARSRGAQAQVPGVRAGDEE